MKLTLVLCLFGSIARADGDMGSGNLQCPPEGCPPPVCVENCLVALQAVDDGTEFASNADLTTEVPMVDLVTAAWGSYQLVSF